MIFFTPLETGFTIYSKSGCSNCTKVKKLLLDKQSFFVDISKQSFFVDISCDEYLLEDKEEFLSFIKEKANKECRIFPMVFKDRKFIGGFAETQLHFDKLLCFGGGDDF
jgi:glutaredoxin